MSAQSAPKVMRIGVFQGDRCLEERLLRKRGPVTIGQTLSNTFVVPASSMPTTYKLFDVGTDGQYRLRVSDRMGGRLSLGSAEVIDLTRLKNVADAKKTADGYEIALHQNARGKVTIGETRVLFQFVTPPAASIGMLPAALGGGAISGFSTFMGAAILGTVALSAVLHMAPLFYVMLQDWPEPEGYQEIPDWYLQQEAEAVEEEEEEKKDEEEPDEDAEGEGKEAEVAEEADLKPTQEKPKESAKQRAPATAEEKRMSKERGKRIIGQVFGVEGGDASIGASIAGDIVGSDAPISALEGLTASDIGGPGGGGLTAGLGLGGSGSATGEPGLKTVEGGGSDQLIGSGGTTSKPVERKKVTLKIQEDTKIPTSVASGDKTGIESVFKNNGKQVENCYKRVIMKYGDQAGKLVVKITIGGDGSVLKVETSVDEIGKGLAACVEAKIKRWKFPRVGKPVTVAKRWVFG